MGTISSCLKKIGLAKHEAAILRGATDDNIKDGDEAHVAAVRAVADYIEQLEKERAGIVAQVEQAGGVAPDALFKLADLADLTRVLRKQEAYNPDKQPEKENVNDQRGSTDLERNRTDADAQDGMGAQDVRAGRDGDGRAGEQRVPGSQEGDRPMGSGELFGHEASAVGEHGYLEIYTGATTVSPGSAGSRVSLGSGDAGLDGAPIEQDATEATERTATERAELGSKAEAQAKANKNPDTGRGFESVSAALPMLHQGQREDVVKAEARFDKDDGYGMLFTNGTGTGKTFTGLGVVRRAVNEGKTDIIITAPNDKIIEDWQNSGKLLGLDIKRLENTADAGSGIVITTYANFGSNPALADRNWHMVVSDEAHYLLMNADGDATEVLNTLRAISLHPDGVHRRTHMLHRELVERLAEADKAAKMARNSDDERDWYQAEALEQKANALRRELEQKRDEVKADIKARQGAKRTRALFLSATPFAYEKTIDWANGYLFDYNEGRASEEGVMRAYNEGSNREQFFMQHLGYRMRYNKLTAPDAKVDSGLMQRQFNSWLKKAGALSGRMLDVEADYDRRFILTESAVGKRIDEALGWFDERQKEYNDGQDKSGGIGSYQADPYTMALSSVRKYIADKFDYLSRRYLLEAIKAKEVIPHVKEHLAMGRKVVVFHDYKKGGGFNPFNIHELEISAESNDEQKQNAEAVNRVIGEFRHAFADLMDHEVFRASSPIVAFQEAFPNVLLFNGDVPTKQRRGNVAKFNDDASGPQVILVQSAAGKEGISLHDTTGLHQRTLFNLGQPTQPTTAIQEEGRTYRTGQVTDAIFRYLTTGTDWERWAFATTIANRASAAENLGMGEMARALKDSFIEAYEDADDYRAGMDGEGKGGKERDRAANEALTEYDRAKAFYFGQQKKTSKNKAAEGADYFATPEPVGLKMVEFAGIRGGNKVLEPSAGHGAIARWFPENAERTAVEPSMKLRPRLAMVFDGKIADTDFESHNVVNKYDAIVMNPPFNKPNGVGGKLAFEHLAKAATHINDGGRIVALLPSGPMATKHMDKFLYGEEERKLKPLLQHQKLGDIYRGAVVKTSAGWAPQGKLLRAASTPGSYWIKPEGKAETIVYPDQIGEIIEQGPKTEAVKPGADLYLVADIKLPGVTFERAGTSVMTHIVVLEKQTDAAKAPHQSGDRDYSRIEDIGELFDRLENVTLAQRPLTEAELAAEKAEAEAPAKPGRGERQAKAEKPQVDMAAAQEQAAAEGLEIIEHTTGKGKVLKGVVRKDLSREQAKAIDEYTFSKDGGYFIRAQHMNSQAYKDSLGGDTPAVMSATAGGDNANVARGLVDRVAADSAIDAAMAGLKDAPKVTLVESFEDLPQNVQDEAKEQDAGEREFKGALKAGHIWILRANHSTVEDIEATLFHELYGHYGARALFGNKWMQEINKLYASVGGWNGVKAIAQARGIDLEHYRKGVLNWDGDKKIWRDPVMMEELLAHMAEQQVNPSLKRRIMDAVQRLVGQFRQWLRDKGFANLEKRGETDLLHLLSESSKAVREGKSVRSGPAMTVLKAIDGVNSDLGEAPAMMRKSAGEAVTDTIESVSPRAANYIRDLFAGDSAKTFGILHKTVSSQFHKAKIDADYRRVYNRAQSFIEDVARYGSEAADLAPDLLPKMDSVSDAMRGLWNAKTDKADVEAISAPIFDGTLYEDDRGNTGKVWSDDELRRHYNLSDKQIKLYRQFREAVDQSLEALAVAEMNKAARANELEAPKAGLGMRALSKFYRDQYLDELNELRQEYDRLSAAYDENDKELKLNADRLKISREQYFDSKTQMHADYATKQKALMARIEELEAMENAFMEKVKTITKLQKEGYAPLMRFGRFSVDVVEARPVHDDNGQPIIDPDTGEMMMEDEHVFFSMFETEREAREAERIMAEEYPNATVSRGVVSEAGWQLFQGTNIDSLKLLADLVGAEDEAVQRFYKHAVSSRSALKRLIHRKGTAGYSQDVSRSLASFLLTNARAAASADHMGDLVEAANDIPKAKGDVKDEAVRLIDYIRNPNEEAGLWRGMLFVQFLGGSISSAAINLTQTLTTTIPYLHQFGAGLTDVAGAAKLAGTHMAGKKDGLSQSLQDALHLAESEGVLQPHNIHALMGASGVQAMQHSRLARVLSSVWGSFFGMAEQYNRQTAFIAAYNLAEKMGQSGLWQAYSKQASLNAGRGLPPPSRDMFASPFAFAKNAVDETQFVLSKAARPNFARGVIGSTFMTFKTFSIFSLELFKRLPNKERAMMLGTLIVLAGVGGLPFSDDGDDLIDTLGQAMGYNTNSKQWRTSAAKEIFGDLGGTFFTEGISAFLPLELQTRLSMGNLIPASGLLKRSNSANMDGQMMEILGPSGGLLKQMMDAWSYLQRGEVGQAVTQGIAPKAIKDIAKGIDMANTGAYTDARGRRIVDTDGLDSFLKSIGFQPRSVSTVRETQSMLMQDKSMVQNVQKSISEVWASGIHERDAAKVKRARELLADWNEKNPETPIKIKMANVQRRANEMGKSASERMLKAMPAGMKAKAAAELEN